MINMQQTIKAVVLSFAALGCTALYAQQNDAKPGAAGKKPAASAPGFVRVEGGTFQMGSNIDFDNAKPVHTVTVKSFSMSQYPVTQKEWFEIMGTTVQQLRGKSTTVAAAGDNYPMYFVTWHDAIDYCNRRSQKEGLTPVYSGSGDKITFDREANGYRLPTEAEWEYAAKGGKNQPYPAFEYSGGNSADEVAWYLENTGGRREPIGENMLNVWPGDGPRPVGTKKPNSLGLYDMSGNVKEWCWDWNGKYPVEPQTDPVGASSGTARVARGGGWMTPAQEMRSTVRSASKPSYQFIYYGFRLVRN